MLGIGDPLRDKRAEFGTLAAEFEDLRTAEADRLERMKDYRKENESAREILPNRASGHDDDLDYGRYMGGNRVVDEKMKHHIPLPFGQALTVKHSYRLSGRPPDAVVDRRQETAQERYRSDVMEKLWWSFVYESGGDTLFADGAWDGSQLGATCYDIYFDLQKQMPRFRAIDPAGVIVVRGVDDVHDFERVYRYWDAPLASVKAQYRDFDLDGTGFFTSPVSDLESSHKVGGVPMVTMVQCATKSGRFRFALGGDNGAVPLYQRGHDLEFVPYIVIPNIGPYRDVWGWADYDSVRALCHYIPALIGREADILRTIAAGAYQGSGTGQDAESIRRLIAEGGYLPLKRDSEGVKPIDTAQMPTFLNEHRTQIMDLFKMLGFAPDASWGGSDTRSGSDRSLQLQPLLELTAMKQMNWSRGLSRMGGYAFQMLEKMMVNTGQFKGYRPGATRQQRSAFMPFVMGPDLEGESETVQGHDPVTGEAMEQDVIRPRSPKELFLGDYSIRFVWQNRIDPDDPAYVLSELNKFAQGVQSLRTTLEHLGFQAPEDEIKLIQEEAERMPWIRQGMIALIQMQLQQMTGGGPGQGAGGGNPGDPLAGLADGLGMTQTKDGGALGADAQTAALPGGMGQLYGGA